MNKNKKKGFTLIELIVVIAILGILAAVAVPRLTGFQDKAKISSDIATYNTISKSITIGVTSEDIKVAKVVVVSDANGVITIHENTAAGTAITTLIEPNSTFKVTSNKSKTTTWNIASGVVTAPGISADGVVTAVAP